MSAQILLKSKRHLVQSSCFCLSRVRTTGNAWDGFLRKMSITSRPWSPYRRSMHLKFRATKRKRSTPLSLIWWYEYLYTFARFLGGWGRSELNSSFEISSYSILHNDKPVKWSSIRIWLSESVDLLVILFKSSSARFAVELTDSNNKSSSNLIHKSNQTGQKSTSPKEFPRCTFITLYHIRGCRNTRGHSPMQRIKV